MTDFNLPISTNSVIQGITTSFQKNKISPQERLISIIRDNDSSGVMADDLGKKLQEDKQLIEKLSVSAIKSSQMAKEAAREKIERIKEQIKILRLTIAVSVNPRAALRQIRQLSRELAAAARDYDMGVQASNATTESTLAATSLTGEKESPSFLANEAALGKERADSPPPGENGAADLKSSYQQIGYNNTLAQETEDVTIRKTRRQEDINMADEIRRLVAQLRNLHRQAVNHARRKKQYLPADNMEINIHHNLFAAEANAVSITANGVLFSPVIINVFI